MPKHWRVTRSWEDQDELEVSPPLTPASSARLLWLLVQETGGQYRDQRATKAQPYIAGRYVFFSRWPCNSSACVVSWQGERIAST